MAAKWKAGRTAWAVAAVIAATPLAAEEADTPATVSVVWQDPCSALPIAPEAVAAELAVLLRGAGLELAWREIAAEEPSRGSDVRMVLLAREAGGPSEVMGSVHRGSSARTAWINLPGVQRTLGLPAQRATWPAGSSRALARALARVVAHELVHLLAPEMPHAREGLMAARLSPRFLTGPDAPVSAPVAAALRRGASAGTPARVALAEGS